MDTSGIMDSVLGALSMSFVLGLDEMLHLGGFAMTKMADKRFRGRGKIMEFAAEI